MYIFEYIIIISISVYSICQVIAIKPKWAIGSATAISLKPKWSLASNSLNDLDDDDDLVDEDELLALDPLVAYSSVSDCGTGAADRKACKNCSCGFTESAETISEVIVKIAVPVVSACGNVRGRCFV